MNPVLLFGKLLLFSDVNCDLSNSAIAYVYFIYIYIFPISNPFENPDEKPPLIAGADCIFPIPWFCK